MMVAMMMMMKHVVVLYFSVIWAVKYEYDKNTLCIGYLLLQWYHLVGLLTDDDDNYQNDNGDDEDK